VDQKGSDPAVERVLAVLPDWVNTLAQLNALIAERMGVSLSDLDCLHALNRDGPATASTLAGRVGLTSGSVSRMIDRLDAAGCIKRVRDPEDRRRVLIEPTAEGLDRVGAYYAGLTARTVADLAEFTETELAALLRFLERSRESAASELARLRARQPGP
jgi:DNA-binding MarR family transcriptional regulator